MKKLALLLITILLLCLSAGALAGQDGKWFYDVEDGGAIVVSYGFDNDNPETELDIPAKLGGYPVTGIGYDAFDGIGDLCSVTLPSTVKKIGWYAFAGCYNLSHVDLPYGLEYIGKGAFSGTDLPHVRFPDSVTSIGGSAFAYGHLEGVIEIPAGVAEINGYTFLDSEDITDIIVKGKDTYIYDCAFEYSETSTAQNDLTITCWKGSPADEYAQRWGYKVKYFEENTITGNGSSSGSTALPPSVTVPAGSFQAITGDGNVVEVPVFVHVEPTAAQTGKLTYEITLVDAFEDKMDVPEGVSIDVLIPYDQLGVTRNQLKKQKVTVEHHLKDGSSEFFSTHDKKMNPAKLTQDGLSFTVTSFSQFDVMIEEAAEELTAALPKTGDDSLPLSMLIAVLGASLIAAFALKRRAA